MIHLHFNEIIYRNYNNETIEYGIINGNKTIVLIKCGYNGTIRGFNDKYIKIGYLLNEKYGYTIICSSNPFNGNMDSIQDAIDLINTKYQEYVIYYIGNSIAATIGAKYGYKYPSIKKMLLINGPLIFNSDKVVYGLKQFNQESIDLIYGSLDSSIRYIEMINLCYNTKVRYHILEGINHNFENKLDIFINLPEKYLLKGEDHE